MVFLMGMANRSHAYFDLSDFLVCSLAILSGAYTTNGPLTLTMGWCSDLARRLKKVFDGRRSPNYQGVCLHIALLHK